MAVGVSDLVRARLARELSAAEDRWMAAPKAAGWRDCATPVADVLRDALGFDAFARFRGRYQTPIGYLRVLRSEGFASIDEALTATAAECGWPRIDVCEAKVGDIGIAPHREGRAFVLHRCGKLWVGVTARGYAATDKTELAFRVC